MPIRVSSYTAAADAPSVGTAIFLGSDELLVGQHLDVNGYMISADGRFALVLQADGNLVLYGPKYQKKWSSNTAGLDATYLTPQSDGNLVLYNATGSIWSSSTSGYQPSNLQLQSDGNAVLTNPTNGALWARGKSGRL